MRFNKILGTVLVAAYGGLFAWMTPGLYQGKLSEGELDGYLAGIERNLAVLPAEERQQGLDLLRAWGRADDGKPVYMLNLMRDYPTLHPAAGLEHFTGTPAEANAFYESKALPMLLKRGDYPIYMGKGQGANLFGHEADADNWGRVLLVRYGSRRHFFQLIADPAYGPIAPYKLASVQLDLAPTGGELVLSDLRILIAGLFLGIYLIASRVRNER
jgi:hypothetical protein